LETARRIYPLNEPHPFPFDQWWVGAYSHEVSRALMQRTILGAPVVFYRTMAGEAVALAGLCPHRLYPLVNGRLEGDTLQCGYHGFTFDQTGRCTRISSQLESPAHFAVRRYALIEHGNVVWIWTGKEPPAAPPSTTQLESMGMGNPAWAVEQHPPVTIKARYQLLIDNLLDLSHISYVHSASIVERYSAPAATAKAMAMTMERNWGPGISCTR
jgi:phenylpropionate dioxygenase-like ring-hydroxylating dioxygenase large terminal subunit